MKKALPLILCIMILICSLAVYSAAASTTVTTLSGLLTAVENAKDGDVITVSGTIYVKEPIIVSSGKNITITGGKLKRSSSYTGNIIEMPMEQGNDPYGMSRRESSAVLTLRDIVLDGYKSGVVSASRYGDLVFMGCGATLITDNADFINNPDDAIAFDSTYSFGSKIHISMKNGKVKNNDGAGICTAPACNTSSLLYVFDGTQFSYNGKTGISLDGSAVLTNVIIEHNGGEGLFFRSKNGSVTLNGGSISENAQNGVSTCEGQFIMLAGKINNNEKNGLYIYDDDASAVISGGEISGNKEYAADNYSVIYLTDKGKINVNNKVLLHEWFSGENRGILYVPEKLSYSDTAASVETKGAAKWEWIYIENGCAGLQQFKSADTEKIFLPSDENEGWAKLAEKPYDLPAPVSSLKAASAGVGKIKLTWKAQSGIDGYHVYRSTSSTGTYKLIKTVSGSASSYTNTTVTTGKKYYYKMFPYMIYKGITLEADTSPGVSATAVPANVTGLTATQKTTSIKLSWKKVTGATGYKIYTYNSTTKKFVLKSKTTKTEYNISNLKTGTKYTFYVKAYKTVNDKDVLSGSYTKIQTATKTSTPVISALTTKSGTATLTWKKVTGATGYEVYRASTKSGTYKKMGSTTKLTYTNKSPKKGNTYYYKIRTYKTVNDKKIYSSYSAIKSIKIK